MRAIPDLGKVMLLNEQTVLAVGGQRLARFNPYTLQQDALFSGRAELVGFPQAGHALALAEEGQHRSLWRINGNPGENKRLLDTIQLALGNLAGRVYGLNGQWVILAQDRKLYLTNGTPQGTRLLRQFSQEIELVGLTPQRVIYRQADAL